MVLSAFCLDDQKSFYYKDLWFIFFPPEVFSARRLWHFYFKGIKAAISNLLLKQSDKTTDSVPLMEAPSTCCLNHLKVHFSVSFRNSFLKIANIELFTMVIIEFIASPQNSQENINDKERKNVISEYFQGDWFWFFFYLVLQWNRFRVIHLVRTQNFPKN